MARPAPPVCVNDVRVDIRTLLGVESEAGPVGNLEVALASRPQQPLRPFVEEVLLPAPASFQRGLASLALSPVPARRS